MLNNIDINLLLYLIWFVLLSFIWFVYYKLKIQPIIIKKVYTESVNQELIKENQYLKEVIKNNSRHIYELKQEYYKSIKDIKDMYDKKLEDVFKAQNKYKED